MMKKFYFDTEFTGLHQNSTLISLALVAESGEEFYAEFTDYDNSQLNHWITEHVLSNLFLNENNVSDSKNKYYVRGTKEEIKTSLRDWINQFGDAENSIQIWSDVPHWDWVLFCELFGGAFTIPKQIRYMPMDVATLLFIKGEDVTKPRTELINKSELPNELKQHNALYDAHLIKLVTEKYLEL